jgi:hypothetical protein
MNVRIQKSLSAITTLLVALTTQASAYDHFLSSNGQLEAYTTANYADGSGMKLFVHKTDGHGSVVLLFSNQRWIDAKWSPDSRFLAVIDHPDGHVADVYVFGVVPGRQLRLVLYYHTPNTFIYDVKWNVAGWHSNQRSIVLSKEIRDQEKRTIIRTQTVARFGTKKLASNQPILR